VVLLLVAGPVGHPDVLRVVRDLLAFVLAFLVPERRLDVVHVVRDQLGVVLLLVAVFPRAVPRGLMILPVMVESLF
jgi:hypothetical protein